MNEFRLHLNGLEDRTLASAVVVQSATTSAAVVSQASEQTKLQLRLDAARKDADVPALAGGIVSGGQTTIAASGVRERGKSVAVTAQDQFHLGSNGKAITATLAGTLVDRGFIRWNTTISDAFPSLRNKIHPTYARVTLEQLLNHRGGLRDENLPSELVEKITTFRGAPWDGRKLFLSRLLNSPPGKVGEYSYSNIGYTIAGAMLESATGNTYEWLVRKHIFNPLGMNSAGFGPPGSRFLDQPRGHDFDTGLSVGNGPSAELPRLASPAGLMHMNMADWSKFLRVHLGERVNGIKLLSDATLRKLQTADPRPIQDNGLTYGFGWIHMNTPSGKVMFHNGSNGFWYSAAVLIPSRKVAVFAVTNQASEAPVHRVIAESDPAVAAFFRALT